MMDAPRPTSDICPECGSGLLDGEHIAEYPCTQRERLNLQTVAAAADNGNPWEWEGGYPQRITRVGDAALVADCFESPDAPSRFAEFIATFDPPTVLALVARITDLEAQLEASNHAAMEYRREREAAEAQVAALTAELEALRDA